MAKNNSGVDSLIDAAQIGSLFSRARFVFSINVTNAAVVGVFLWNPISNAVLLAWVLTIIGISAIRFNLLLKYERDRTKAEHLGFWKTVATWGSAFSGIAWGVSWIILFPQHSLFQQIFLLVAIVGMMAGSAVSWHAYFPAFRAYFLPAALLTSIRFILVILSGNEDRLMYAAFGVLFLLFSVGLYGLARNSNQLLTRLLISQHENLASDERYRALFHGAKVPMLLIDPTDGRIEDANAAAESYYGYSHGLLIQMNIDQINIMSREEITKEMFNAVQEKKSTFNFRHKLANGVIRDVETHAGSVKLKDRHLLYSIIHDITDRRLAEDLLLKQKQFSTDVIDSLPGIFYMLNQQGGFVRINPQFERVSGYSSDEILSMSALGFFEGNDKDTVAQAIQEVFEKGDSSVEARFITHSGQKIPYYFSGHRTRIEDQLYVVGLGTDISERKQAEESLLITASVFDNTQEAILITDTNNTIVDVNPAFTRITGYSREEVLGENPRLLGSERQDKVIFAQMWQSLEQFKHWRGEVWNQRKSGETYAGLISISSICGNDGNVLRYVAVFSDISHIKEHEAELSRVAHYDVLTGIPNRILLADRMRQAIAQTSREQTMMAVCYLDLDGFKPINDSLGHEAGDQLLIEVSRRMENTIRGGDTVARLGGDEFVVLLLGLEKGEECLVTLERLLGAISQPVIVKNKSSTVSASIGVSIYPLDEEDPDTLLRHADQAMYVAKQSGKNRFHIYDPAMDRRAREQHEFLKSIRYGLENDQFVLYYQPKINLLTQQLVGVEALIRWRHPERGLLSPAEFLRYVENTDLDIEIGEWVTATALSQGHQWRNAGLDIEVSINISGYHLESPHFTERLQQQLMQYPDLPFGKLQIEVLETVALDDLAVVREIIESCRKFGVAFALDDFGTGYSSLSYLSKLPIDVLKIDQSFVRDMLEDKGDMAIVQGIIALASAFDRQAVAEGIETREHYLVLRDMRCDVGQGYGIARPMPAGDITKWHATFLISTAGIP